MTVDDRQDFLRLLGDAFAPGLVGDDAGEIDGVAVDDDLAHARSGIKTLNRHFSLPLLMLPISLSARQWLLPATQIMGLLFTKPPWPPRARRCGPRTGSRRGMSLPARGSRACHRRRNRPLRPRHKVPA